MTLDDIPSLSIFYLKKRRVLLPGSTIELAWFKGDQLLIRTRLFIEQDGIDMVGGKVYFDRTDCHFGGERLWFFCPECGRRSAVLYGADFVCRKCIALDYGCQYENDLELAKRRTLHFKHRAFGTNSPLIRPKYQHNHIYLFNLGTYCKLRKEESLSYMNFSGSGFI